MSYGMVKQQAICEKTLDYLFQNSVMEEFSHLRSCVRRRQKSNGFMTLVTRLLQPKPPETHPVPPGDE